MGLINKIKHTIAGTKNSNYEFEQLEKLAKLKEAGIITEEEFEKKKKDLLRNIK